MSSADHNAVLVDRPIRWGILGTGAIASAFTADLSYAGNARAVAVGSRTLSTAGAFAERFDIARSHGSYEDLVHDADVDVVYVSTPHPMHYDCAMLAIRAGKHVLVEKPFTLDAIQARGLVEAARAQRVFCMEAMVTRFLPHIVEIRQLLASGVLGDVRTVTADRGQWSILDAKSRLFAPELGGGALLDLGVYPISFASMVLGRPDKITAVSDPAFTGVDGQTSMILQVGGGRHAVLTTTLGANTSNRATIVGADARIEVDPVFCSPSSFSVINRDGAETRHEHTPVGHGLHYQAVEVERCLRAGQLESPHMPLDETVQIMETMDEIRHQIDLVYSHESESSI